MDVGRTRRHSGSCRDGPHGRAVEPLVRHNVPHGGAHGLGTVDRLDRGAHDRRDSATAKTSNVTPVSRSETSHNVRSASSSPTRRRIGRLTAGPLLTKRGA